MLENMIAIDVLKKEKVNTIGRRKDDSSNSEYNQNHSNIH